uniref:Uncharacterized protein n=1 Tax=Aegilops tauschii subsp. strangulata TaxID=200361 RepID=A0A453EW04_AEGTS
MAPRCGAALPHGPDGKAATRMSSTRTRSMCPCHTSFSIASPYSEEPRLLLAHLLLPELSPSAGGSAGPRANSRTATPAARCFWPPSALLALFVACPLVPHPFATSHAPDHRVRRRSSAHLCVQFVSVQDFRWLDWAELRTIHVPCPICAADYFFDQCRDLPPMLSTATPQLIQVAGSEILRIQVAESETD